MKIRTFPNGELTLLWEPNELNSAIDTIWNVFTRKEKRKEIVWKQAQVLAALVFLNTKARCTP